MSEQIKRQHIGTWIPACLEADPSLSISQEKLLAIINTLDDPRDGCTASNGYLAPYLKVSKASVSRIISGLKDMGHISVKLFRDSNNKVEKRVIRVLHPALLAARGIVAEPMIKNEHTPIRKNEHTLCSEMSIPVRKNAKGIIKSIEKNNKEGEEEKNSTPAQAEKSPMPMLPGYRLIDPYDDVKFRLAVKGYLQGVPFLRMKQEATRSGIDLGRTVESYRLWLCEQVEKFEATGTGLSSATLSERYVFTRLQRWVLDQNNFERNGSKSGPASGAGLRFL